MSLQDKIDHSIALIRTAEDYFDWWLSHISLDEYIAKKRQLEINFEKNDNNKT